ncbi:ATP-dependent DNA helicase PIF1-like [Pecten maximus]|uniref:ATP-dependent DNA helicase PIF1-like n=1 Tax=Pecten maximus TaxID=6579 RepID=UPI001458B493|nr:ATP-dependent DNA helicase PIF1-like [Pecten maximus]
MYITRNILLVSFICSDVGGKTLHTWAGIEDGRHLNEEITHLVKTDERFEKIKGNIEKVDVLIIDEVSMISAKVLHQVQVLCKEVRNSSFIFGNIQVILVGDFYQLPPISNQLNGDNGKYCFTLPWFDDYFQHKICLPLIHRQTDVSLIKCINELETGEVSDESVGFINSLNRPIENEEAATQLFAKNLDVDIFNYKKLNTLEGKLKVYKSKDEGSHHYLNKFLAPKNLALKVGCPVMLVKNLSDKLVNGLRGVVTALDTYSVDVKFILHDKDITSNIKTTKFTTFDLVDKTILAKRVQLPLKVAYAITVHKSQGMSLHNVVVNCENCYQAGQVGVAVGRAVSITGLRVLNFKKSLCKSHSIQVKGFYKNINLGHVDANLTCCRKEQLSESNEEYDDTCGDPPVVNPDIDSDYEFFYFCFNENEDAFIEQVQTVRSKEALSNVMKEFIDTPMETIMLSFEEDIRHNYQSFDNWFKNQYSVIEDIGLNCYPEDVHKFSQKHRNDFFQNI